MILFGVYDKCVEKYVDFIISPHKAEVVRQMRILANTKGTLQNLAPQDFSIKALADVADIGYVVPFDDDEFVEVLSLIEKENEENV